MSDKAVLTLEQFIKDTASGKIFTVEFVKRTNNEMRVMTARRGVTKGVKGVGQAFNPAEYNLLTVYDMQKLDENDPKNKGKSVEEMEKGAFRNINLDQLVALRMGGKSYNWDNNRKVFVEK